MNSTVVASVTLITCGEILKPHVPTVDCQRHTRELGRLNRALSNPCLERSPGSCSRR